MSKIDILPSKWYQSSLRGNLHTNKRIIQRYCFSHTQVSKTCAFSLAYQHVAVTDITMRNHPRILGMKAAAGRWRRKARPRSMSCLASCLADTLETCSPNVSQKPQVYKSHSSASNPQSNSILIKIQTPRQDSFSFFIRIVLSQQSQCKLAFFAQANGTLVQLHINVNCVRGASHRNYVRPVGLRIAAN